jgi:hypothetical protein
MDPARTPLTANSQFIQAGNELISLFNYSSSYPTPDDDDDLDEENIPGFSHPALSPQHAPVVDKGKGRANYTPEQLAPPSTSTGRPTSPVVSGNIGSPSHSAPRGNRQMLGGVQVETRYLSILYMSPQFSNSLFYLM